MKIDVVKICASLILILALLMCSSVATETTWRHSGFELWGYDINYTNMNATNVWVLDFEDNGVPSISDSDSGILYYNDTNASILVSVNGSNYTEMQTADMKNVANGIAGLDSIGQILDASGNIAQTKNERGAMGGYAPLNGLADLYLSNIPDTLTGKTTDGNAIISNGSYTGDNTANRAIPHGLGFIPKSVKLCGINGGIHFIVRPGYIEYVDHNVRVINALTTWDTTNFYVGIVDNSYTANGAGATYYWVAFS